MPEQQLFHLRTRTGMVFQEGALFDSLTVRDNVAYQLIQEEAPDEEIDSRVREALRFVGLEQTFSLLPRKPFRRHAPARRHRPRTHPHSSSPALRLADRRPRSRHFHHDHRADRETARRLSHPSVLVTHRLQDAFTMCSHRFEPAEDRMVPLPKDQTDPKTTFLMLNEGHLIFDGSLHQLVSSQDPFVREFIE